MVETCMNDFCIYWDNRHCILNKISLNEIGMCNECIAVYIPEAELAAIRKSMVEEFEKSDRALYDK